MGVVDVDEGFYASLTPFDGFAHVAESSVYRAAPRSWFVLLTDVVNSTSAIRAGRYRDVNAIGVATIVAAVNAAGTDDLPYVFTGDGAVVLGPVSARGALERAAAQAAYLASEAFGFNLRAGVIPMADLIDAGSSIAVAKMRLTEELHLAMLDGPGTSLAEDWLRQSERAQSYSVPPVDRYDPTLFEGFECRWRPLASRHGRIVSLLVRALGTPEQKRQTYAGVLHTIETLAKDPAEVRPIGPDNLQLASAEHLDREARVRTGRKDGFRPWLHRVRVSLVTGIGRFLLRNKRRVADFDGATYVDQVLDRTDFRKFDGTLRMILDLTEAQEGSLRKMLEDEDRTGRLAFGMHCDREAVLTCLIRDYASRHLHFLDGGGGGYALAAVELKQQMQRKAEQTTDSSFANLVR
jgi:hypothetical protein